MADIITHKSRTDRRRIFKLGGGVAHATRHAWRMLIVDCALCRQSNKQTLLSPRKRGMFSPALVCLSVCLSVTTITKMIVDGFVDGFVPNFMGRFLREREDQVRVSLRSVEGCGSNRQKTP